MLDCEGGRRIGGRDNEVELVSLVGGNLAIDLVPYAWVEFLYIVKLSS